MKAVDAIIGGTVFRALLRLSVVATLALSGVAAGLAWQSGRPHLHPAIAYPTAPRTDRVATLQERLRRENITLDYAGLGPVARYETLLVAPEDSTNSQIEIPTGYLRAEFDRYWSYDAATGDRREYALTYPGNKHKQFSPASGFGGVIISDSTRNYAMGIYGVLHSAGGSVKYFTLWSFISGSPDTDADDFDTSKFSAVYGPGTVLAGYEYTFTTWVMTGTLDEVTGHMDALYALGELGGIEKKRSPEPRMGDANFDGLVDDKDLSIVLAHWGLAGGWEQGDFNGTGYVVSADLSLLLANWSGTDGAGGRDREVPEPASAWILLAGARVVGRRRKQIQDGAGRLDRKSHAFPSPDSACTDWSGVSIW